LAFIAKEESILEKESKITKVDILKKIEAMLRQNINLDVRQVFTKIEEFLEPKNKPADFAAEGIGYVHIDEKRQTEYLEWEKGIRQEWFATIEDIRESIRREQDHPLA